MKKRCKNGTRKNRKTGECEDIIKKSISDYVIESVSEIVAKPVTDISEPESRTSVPKFPPLSITPNGTRKIRKPKSKISPLSNEKPIFVNMVNKKEEPLLASSQESSPVPIPKFPPLNIISNGTRKIRKPKPLTEPKSKISPLSNEKPIFVKMVNKKEETMLAPSKESSPPSKESSPPSKESSPPSKESSPPSEQSSTPSSKESSLPSKESSPPSEQSSPPSKEYSPPSKESSPSSEQSSPPSEQSSPSSEQSSPPSEQSSPHQPEEEPIFPEIDDSENDFLYPLLDDPDFIHKISQHKEFIETRYNGDMTSIENQSTFMCNAKFEISPHQTFVKNFLSTQTPYNSLLLYHMLGSGKTCSAIGIAEEMRAYTKQMGISKKIIIVASPNVQQNFKKQLFDERKMEQINGKWFIDRTCIGSELLKEINPTNVRGLSRGHIVQQIQVLISQHYEFMGYIEFSNYMSRVLQSAKKSYTENDYERTQYIRKFFDNQLIIIDEVHNINILDTASTNKKTAKNLLEIAANSEGMRLLFLSATPMYNSPTEIIWLVNLMNVNDKRPLIEPSQVFDKNGDFVKANAEKGIEDGRALLQRKLIGYISFVRGENPYLFPFRVYPDVFAKEHSINSLQAYPQMQMNERKIEQPLQHVPVYLNPVGEYQQYVYEYVVESMANKVYQGQRKMPDFENMESFGYTMLYSPLESLVMTYPNEQMDEIVKMKIAQSAQVDAIVPIDKKIFANSSALIKRMIGKGGLSQIVDYKEDPKVPIRYDFEYKPAILKKYNRIFSQEILPKYGAKISHVCQKILESTGIVLVYSQYIDGGIVPMALALEEMGFSRYSATQSHNRNLFRKPPSPKIDWKTMKPAKDMEDKSSFQQAKYVMITGDRNFSPNNAEDIKYVTEKENCYGKQVKVILISKAASEGVDFRNIRQTHILQPWYNMNRIEQTIGRSVRNQSHCDLPFQERNVEIYLHASILPKTPTQEAADLYVYRMAERKAKQIGQVTRLLKENAVDCVLNIAQTNFTSDKLTSIFENQNITVRLSSGKMIEHFPVGDRPYSDLCDYMDNCAFKCAVRPELAAKEPNELGEITTNYSEDFLKANSEVIMSRIRDLFREHTAFTRDQLVASINIIKKYPIHHIYYALTKMANRPTEELVDQYGRMGYLVNRGNTYAFQPSEILDESATMYERTTPVDFKHSHLKFEIPQKFNKEIPTEKSVLLEKQQESKNDLKHLVEPISVGKLNEFERILADITQQFAYLTNPISKINESEKNWFKHASHVVISLRSIHQISEDKINEYAAYHYLDTLDIEDKLIVAKHFYGIENNHLPKNQLESFMKSYIDRNILRKKDNERIGLVLATTESLQFYEKSPGEEWVFVPKLDFYTKYQDSLTRYIVSEERIFKEIGFMGKFQKGDEISMVFKIKTTKLENVNKGAKADSANKTESIIPKLNAVWGNDTYKHSEKLKKTQLCVILEILMRYLTDAPEEVIRELIPGRSTDFVYFFGPEYSRFNEIWNK